MAYEREVKTQVFVGTELGKGRKMFLFERDDGSDKRDKVSAFEPYENLEELVPGETYTYEMENVPMPNTNPQKYYHNFVRANGTYGKNANGPYKIQLGDDVNSPSGVPQTKKKAVEKGTPDILPAPMGNEKPQPQQGKKNDETFLIREAMREFNQRRGGLSHDAAVIVAAIVPYVEKQDLSVDALVDLLAIQQVRLTNQLVGEAEAKNEEHRKKVEAGLIK